MTDPLTTLINHHAHSPDTAVPSSLEVRRHAWRLAAQARFDAVGLPRGVVGVR